MKQTLFCTLALLLISGQTTTVPAAALPAAKLNARLTAQASNQCISSFYFVRTQDGDFLNVRQKPSTSAAVVGELLDGTEVVVNLYDRTGQWAEVSVPKGKKSGWVAVRYLEQAAIGGELPNGSMRVKTLDGDRVNVRVQPINNAKVVGTLPSGAKVTFVENEGYWSKIVASNGVRGYIANQYLVCE